MNSLVQLLRSIHGGTFHQRVILDALPLVASPAGRRLGRIVLRHHDRYLRGAIDPDVRFRDFQNHVIHVDDGFWGGAPRVAHQWYDRMQRYLFEGRRGDAAHAAGVLSHYFIDVMLPMHSRQSDAERVLHRPIEWSLEHAYDTLHRLWRDDDVRIVFDITDSPQWLGESMLHAARFGHGRFDTVVDGYDLATAVQDPESGFDDAARRSLSEIIGLALTGWARVIDRAGEDAEEIAEGPLPSVSTAATWAGVLTATPLAYWRGCVHEEDQRDQIEALISEYERTGQLDEQLPAEVDIVRRVIEVRRRELEWQQRRVA